MKFSKTIFAIMCCAVFGSANAANITIFYSPTCPHCHHARDFISSTLIYEYNDLEVMEINVTNRDNTQSFVDALYKCKYTRGGVPVIVIGDKCFQGYANSMENELRTAIEVDLTDEQKASAAANKAEMANDKDAFVALHADRKNAISDKDAVKQDSAKQEQK